MIFGIGIGALIPNQTIAITVLVVWSSIIEAFLTGFVPEVGRWLPTGAASALGGTWTIEGGPPPVLGRCTRSHRLLRVRSRRRHSPHHPQGHRHERTHRPDLLHPIAATFLHPNPNLNGQSTMTRTLLPVRLAAIAFAAVLAVGCTAETLTTDPSSPPSTVTTVPPSISTTSAASTTSAPSQPVPSRTTGCRDCSTDGQAKGAVASQWRSPATTSELTVAAAGSAGPDGGTVEPDSAFRVGSLSKTFVAVMLLQLVADGTIGLDDLVVDHAPDLTIADGVTIRQLLAHRSGIPEHTDGELAPAVLADPARTWTPADVLELVADQPRDFAPGTQFAYSNTNYIVAGLLLESVTGMTLADNLQSRIVEPLGLTSTYFAPDDARSPIGGFSNSLPGGDTSGDSYRALETAAGAAGALVSTASDLAIFIRALAHGELLDERHLRGDDQGPARQRPDPRRVRRRPALDDRHLQQRERPRLHRLHAVRPGHRGPVRAPPQRRQPVTRTTRQRPARDRPQHLNPNHQTRKH